MTEHERRVADLCVESAEDQRLAIRGAIELSDMCCRQEIVNLDLENEIKTCAERKAYEACKSSVVTADRYKYFRMGELDVYNEFDRRITALEQAAKNDGK